MAALGELWARATWQEPMPSPPADEDLSDLPVLTTLFELGAPNTRGVHMGVLFRTSSRGLRGPEIEPVAAPGVRRVGLGGDSVTMGWGVEEELRYSDRAQALLDSAGADARWELVNTGIAGLNATWAVRRLLQLDAVFDFDALVYGFTVNDIEGDHYATLGRPGGHARRFAELTRARSSPSYLWRVLWPKLVTLRERLSTSQVSMADEVLHNYLENPAAWTDFEAALDTLAEASVARGRCGVVLLHTRLDDLGALHPYRPVYDLVARAAEARGLVAVPTFDAFAGRTETALWVGPFDPHPNVEGHALLAERLAAALLALPDTCWTEAPTSAAGG